MDDGGSFGRYAREAMSGETHARGQLEDSDFATAREDPAVLAALVRTRFEAELRLTGIPAHEAAAYCGARVGRVIRAIEQARCAPGEESAYLARAARSIFIEWEAKALHEGSFRGARKTGASESEAEDIAQQKVLEQLERQREFGLGKARAVGFVAGKRAVIDGARRTKRLVAFDEDAPDRSASSESEEDEAALREHVLAYRELLPQLGSPSYREILDAVARGTKLNELAKEDLARSPVGSSGAPRTLKQARNKLDVRLGRAKRRLRQLILERAAKELS